MRRCSAKSTLFLLPAGPGRGALRRSQAKFWPRRGGAVSAPGTTLAWGSCLGGVPYAPLGLCTLHVLDLGRVGGLPGIPAGVTVVHMIAFAAGGSPRMRDRGACGRRAARAARAARDHEGAALRPAIAGLRCWGQRVSGRRQPPLL